MKELVGISLAKKNRNGKRILHFHTGGQRVGAYIYKSNSYAGNCGRRLAGWGMGGVACMRSHKLKRQATLCNLFLSPYQCMIPVCIL